MKQQDEHQLRERYKVLFLQVREIINRNDPIGISIPKDFPEDEYDAEVAMIVALLNKGLSRDEFSERLSEMFARQFDGTPESWSKYSISLAEDLLHLMTKRTMS